MNPGEGVNLPIHRGGSDTRHNKSDPNRDNPDDDDGHPKSESNPGGSSSPKSWKAESNQRRGHSSLNNPHHPSPDE